MPVRYMTILVYRNGMDHFGTSVYKDFFAWASPLLECAEIVVHRTEHISTLYRTDPNPRDIAYSS